MDEENVGEHVYLHILNNAKKYVYITVSYTHLDVYKRQVFCRPTAGAMKVAGGSGVHQDCPGDIAAVLFTISHLLAAA